MERGIAHCILWCGTRHMTADGRTEGNIDRDVLRQAMGGTQAFRHDLKRHVPCRAGQTSWSAAA
eukprot:2265146-Pyramimonas_sp.AAC.1